MDNKKSILYFVKNLDLTEKVTASQLEVAMGINLIIERSQDEFEDLLGPSEIEYKIYKSENPINNYGVNKLTATERKSSNDSFVSYVELGLSKSISITEVKDIWGNNSELIVNRPTFPVGDRCLLQYETALSTLRFGFSDCETMDRIIKITVTKKS
jgi:hypothetical protein